jgi:hypothetical protein
MQPLANRAAVAINNTTIRRPPCVVGNRLLADVEFREAIAGEWESVIGSTSRKFPADGEAGQRKTFDRRDFRRQGDGSYPQQDFLPRGVKSRRKPCIILSRR